MFNEQPGYEASILTATTPYEYTQAPIHLTCACRLVKMPPLVSDRELVQCISQRTDKQTGTTTILYRNAKHHSRPESKGVIRWVHKYHKLYNIHNNIQYWWIHTYYELYLCTILVYTYIIVLFLSCRAETILSGTIIRPDPQDANSTRMSVLFQFNLKGWIPRFIVNAFAARAPGQWRDTLFNFYQNVYSKELQEEVEGYEFQFLPECVLKRKTSMLEPASQ